MPTPPCAPLEVCAGHIDHWRSSSRGRDYLCRRCCFDRLLVDGCESHTLSGSASGVHRAIHRVGSPSFAELFCYAAGRRSHIWHTKQHIVTLEQCVLTVGGDLVGKIPQKPWGEGCHWYRVPEAIEFSIVVELCFAHFVSVRDDGSCHGESALLSQPRV